MAVEHRWYTVTITHPTAGTLQVKQLFETFREDPDKPARTSLLYIPAEYKVLFGIASVKLIRRDIGKVSILTEMRPECRLTSGFVIETDCQVSRPVNYDLVLEPSVIKHIPR